MNGSVTPRVTGWRLPSGSLTIFRSSWFCQKQRPRATTNAPAAMMSRVRSSSRCSTRLRRSSCPIGRIFFATATGRPAPLRRGVGSSRRLSPRLFVGGGRGRHGGRRDRRRLRGPRLLELLVVVVALAGDGVLELAHPLAERAAHLGQL